MVVVAATAAAVDTGNCIAKSKGPSSRRAFLLFYPSHSATLDDSSCQSSRQLCLDPKNTLAAQFSNHISDLRGGIGMRQSSRPFAHRLQLGTIS